MPISPAACHQSQALPTWRGSSLGADHVLSTTFGSSNQLFARAPGLPAGVYDLTVTDPNGWRRFAGAYRVTGPTATDLYGFDYELTSARPREVVGMGTWLTFVIHRLAGDAALTNVAVNFYLGSPTAAGKIGRGVIASLAPNRSYATQVAWMPGQAEFRNLHRDRPGQSSRRKQRDKQHLPQLGHGGPRGAG